MGFPLTTASIRVETCSIESRAELSLSTLWPSFSYHFFFAGTAPGAAAGGVAEAGNADGVLGFALGRGAFAPSLTAPAVD
jgi:hypothetical protein